ncbi:MAG: Ig-like domain-containing protein [Anaerolineales bacterium]|nr:Ig-like domain-containing protein [Anaerolineales bacterium]
MSINRKHLRSFVLIIIVFIMGCALPTLPFLQTPTAVTPTVALQQLPPALVEADPPSNSQLSLTAPITFYFNQDMKQATVETALGGLPAGGFTWLDGTTVTYSPEAPYQPGSTFSFTLPVSITASNGLEMQAPVTLTYQVSDHLQPVQTLPESGSVDVTPDSAVVAAFNQPVVPLGAAPDSLPEGFTIQPAASGKGEWLNTSTYIFYPDPPLSGGASYTASLNPSLTATSGAGIDPASGQNSWVFTTSLPYLVSIEPETETGFPLDPEITLTFNQPMDAASLESSFSLDGPTGLLAGSFSWNEDFTVVNFQPDENLNRDSDYTIRLSAETQASGGTPLGEGLEITVHTYSNMRVLSTAPEQGGTVDDFPVITFSVPLADVDYNDYITVEPDISNMSVSVQESNKLVIYGERQPETSYTLTISEELEDRWGQSLGAAFTLEFNTAPAAPDLNLTNFASLEVFTRPAEAGVYVNAVNITSAEASVAPLALTDYFSLTASARQNYQPENAKIYNETYFLPPSVTETIKIPLASGDAALDPGIYFVRISSDDLGDRALNPVVVISSDVNLVFKDGPTEALVWATDLRSQVPVVNAPVSLYASNGTLLASGQTDEQGIWKGLLPETQEDTGSAAYAVLGQPGDDFFSLAANVWNSGISPWDFNLGYSQSEPSTKVYLYTDRPIYRPGQTVYFRGIVRQAFNGRYQLPQATSVSLTLGGYDQDSLVSFDLPVSQYGTFHGEYLLPEDASPGYYWFYNDELNISLYFDVAEYRKPEINLGLEITPQAVRQGETLQAEVEARYYFDAPSGDLPVQWKLYAYPYNFSIPGYRVGKFDTTWFYPYFIPGYFGSETASGETRTSADGTISLTLTDIPEAETAQTLTLEIVAEDESGFPLSTRTSALVHPEDFYIGLKPDQWVGRVNTEMTIEVLTADWEKNPSPEKTLTAEFSKVTWETSTDSYGMPVLEPVYEGVETLNGITTDADGLASLSFIPESSGTFMLEVRGEKTVTQILLWISGQYESPWPNLSNQHLKLTTNQDSYQPGDMVEVFIPNSLGENTLALVTVERAVVFSSEIIEMDASGSTFTLLLTDEHAPNVYVSVSLIGTGNRFLQGYVNLPVNPSAQELNIELVSEPERAGPGDELTLDLLVTDSQDSPVQGEFSLSVVDLAALALADPNVEDILPAFYGKQPLGISSSLSLAAYTGRFVWLPGGMGGGGGGGAPKVIREEFPDTASWIPTLVTDAEGRGQVVITLPDTLTTWRIDVRGATQETWVGQSALDVVSTKPLLIRPVTPRFLVVGDHIEMAAIVHNNTDQNLQVDVLLQAIDFILDHPESAKQVINVPAGERQRVSWWGMVPEAETTELIFSAETGTLSDITRPVWGTLPVLSYIAPQTYATGGVLSGTGSRLEVISLPRSYEAASGELKVEFSASLAGVLLNSLEAIQLPEYTCSSECILSYLLPNLETYRALQAANLESPTLNVRLQTDIEETIRRLLTRQNSDGGWGWWASAQGKSDPYISAYALFGLQRARQAGFVINDSVFEKGREYLANERDTLNEPGLQNWQIDRIVFIMYVLQETGGTESHLIDTLYSRQDQLSPWARALLALAMNSQSSGDTRAQTLISNLESGAIRSATGVHWDSNGGTWHNPGTPHFTTAVVAYALAQQNPGSTLLPDAVRYLTSVRNPSGLWSSTYETSWTIMALSKALQSSGDLQASYSYSATLNNNSLVSGQTGGDQTFAPNTVAVEMGQLFATAPNSLNIHHGEGPGSLYYRAALEINRPVEAVKALKQGLEIQRSYYSSDCEKECQPLNTVQLGSNTNLKVHLTLTVPRDTYYLQVKDYIPAGSEILDQVLKTSQQGEEAVEIEYYDPERPYASGWGWWLFNRPQIHDEYILWTSDYLPSGTYELTYTIVPLQAGQFRVLPAHTWLTFFPEVQGTSNGTIFEITP